MIANICINVKTDFGQNIPRRPFNIEKSLTVESNNMEPQETSTWRHKPFAERVEYMYTQEIGTDVILTLGKEKFRAIKAVLVGRSSVFEKMLKDNDTEIEIGENDLCLKGKEQVFKKFLRFLHTGEIKMSYTEAIDIMHLADKYEVEELKTKTAEHLVEFIDLPTVCDILQLAVESKRFALKTKCLNYIFKNGEKVLTSDGFRKLEEQRVREIIKNDELVSNEKIVYENVVQWGKYGMRGQNASDMDLKTAVKGLLSWIRFPIMDKEYFRKAVANEAIMLSEDEIISILLYHAGNTSSPIRFPTKHRKTNWIRKLKSLL